VADLTYYASVADDELTILFWHRAVFARRPLPPQPVSIGAAAGLRSRNAN
jgi:hypothetical protein